jgi:hypothetical protein
VPKPEYVQAVLKEMGGGMAEARPVSSVVRTISESNPATPAPGPVLSAPPLTAAPRTP